MDRFTTHRISQARLRHPLTQRHTMVRARRGAYAVEFALCATVFFSSIFGCFELARYMYVRQALDQTAYEAARTGVISGASSAEVELRAQSLLAAYGVTVASLEVLPQTIDENTREISVTITCDFAQNSWLVGHYVSDEPMVATVTLDHENQAYLVPAAAAEADDLNNNDEPLDV